MRHRGLDAFARLAAVVPAVIEGDYLERIPVMVLQDAGEQKRGGMLAELAG